MFDFELEIFKFEKLPFKTIQPLTIYLI